MNSFEPGIDPSPDGLFSAEDLRLAVDSGHVLVAGYSFHSETPSAEARAGQPASPRAAILYADAVEAVPGAEGDDGETLLGLLKGRKRFRELVSGFGGLFACYTGNFIIAEFEDVDTALQCAVNVQLALGNLNACLQHRHRIRYRLGIEVGKSASAPDSQQHRAVDLVAELERAESPGGIYVSQLARKHLRQTSVAQFVSMGKRYLPSASEPVEAFWIEMDRSMLFDIS